MAKKSGQTFELPRKSNLVADLFTTQEQRDEDKREKVQDIPLSQLDPFPDHPFQVKLDESMQAMADSVKAVGIQTPAVVRLKDDGRFELVSGHRRKMAAELAGLDVMPCIVREMSRDEAIIAMVDANLQRETILLSERAKSYKMRYDAMKRQGKRTDLTLRPVGAKSGASRSDEQLAEKTEDSARQIQRYIRLNDLIPQVLDMVDAGKIAMCPAVELSYLPAEAQQMLLGAIESEDCAPSQAQAVKMRKFSEEGHLDNNVILSIMQENTVNQSKHFKLPQEKIRRFFTADTSAKVIEDTIIKALELWRDKNKKAKG